MTEEELGALIGQKGWLPVFLSKTAPAVWVEVTIQDTVVQWGHRRVHVCPVAGVGCAWVSVERLTFTEPIITE